MKKLITTKGTEFEQNRKDLALIDTESRGGMPVMISSSDLNEGFTNAESDVKTLVGFDVEGEEITITPTTSQQIITPSAGKNAITKATVNAVNLEDKSITIASNTTTIISPGTEYTGLSTVSVITNIPEPTGNIDITTTNQTNVKDYATAQVVDADLVAGNIKKDVNILGVVGTYEGSGTPDWSAIGYSGTPQSIIDGYNYAIDIQENWDDTLDYLSYEYQNDTHIKYFPLVDTSNIEYFDSAFEGSTLEYIPLIDTSNGTNFSSMFTGCKLLTTIPAFDLSNGTNLNEMFRMSSIKEIPNLDMSSATTISSMFQGCVSLETIGELKLDSCENVSSLFYNNSELTNLGGFKDLGKAYSTSASENYSNYTLNLSSSYSSNITHDSLMNIINKLYDIKTKGCNNQSLVLGATNLAKLTAEEIAIATNKGWNVS